LEAKTHRWQTRLALLLRRAILESTGHRVRRLSVCFTDHGVVISGTAPSFRVRQAALDATLDVISACDCAGGQIAFEVTVKTALDMPDEDDESM
jgi:hypothetical protein